MSNAAAAADVDVVLATWRDLFPLSRDPAERVARQLGPHVPAETLRAATTLYIREFSASLPAALKADDEGNLYGPPDYDGDAGALFFAAVLAADLNTIVRGLLDPADRAAPVE